MKEAVFLIKYSTQPSVEVEIVKHAEDKVGFVGGYKNKGESDLETLIRRHVVENGTELKEVSDIKFLCQNEYKGVCIRCYTLESERCTGVRVHYLLEKYKSTCWAGTSLLELKVFMSTLHLKRKHY